MRRVLTSQVINFSSHKIFLKYANKYDIDLSVFYPGLTGIEIRTIPESNSLIKLFRGDRLVFFRDNDLLIIGPFNLIKSRIENLTGTQVSILKENIIKSINNFENYGLTSYKIGNIELVFNHIYSMGILNITPDSFSDGGLFFEKKEAVERALKMIDSGIDIIDIGGESTRPGSSPVASSEEINRVTPVIKELMKLRPGAIISIDTTKNKVAEAALDSGVCIVNDISGATFDNEIINVAKKYSAGLILMHILGTPINMQENPEYKDVVSDVYEFLSQQSDAAKDAGIQKIFVDPGIGFGKNLDHNIELINQLDSFKSLGYPIVIGLSRKSLFKKLLNLEVDERDFATAVLNTVAIGKGARIIRSHNIDFALQTCKLLNRINNSINV